MVYPYLAISKITSRRTGLGQRADFTKSDSKIYCFFCWVDCQRHLVTLAN